MVDGSGVLKVTDFGLARPVRFGQRLTAAGFIVGTPLYMPPEALVGGDVDARADLYAAGVVLFECLTGSVPFDALSPVGMLNRIQQGPPLYLLGPEVPTSLRTLIGRLLEPDLERRLGSAKELSEELSQVTRVG
jgi:serine/threonine protein kinase